MSQIDRASLDENQDITHHLLDVSPHYLYVYDVFEQRLISVSPDLFSDLGYTPEQIQQRAVVLLVEWLLHPDDYLHFRDQIQHLPPAQMIEGECRLKNANGEWRSFYTEAAVFARSDEGAPRQLAGCIRALTDDKSYETELQTLKNHFIATVSHEFRTPLASILASAELLERYFDPMSLNRRNDCLLTIKTQIMRLKKMMDDITLVMGGTTHLVEVEPEFVDVVDFCRDLSADFQAEVAHHRMRFTAPEDIGSAMLDRTLVSRMLTNLLLNAAAYSPAGSPIDLDLSRQENQLSFRIHDQGIGIPTADQPHIFDAFYRASNVGNIAGAGLGLTIVQDYVNLLKGTIQVESAEGAGATFTLRLPIGGWLASEA